MKMQLKYLPIESLQRGQYQPRRVFDEETLQELAQSIRTQGLIEPLIVREITDEHYEIIAGERRWRAAMLAGVCELPCLISKYSDQQAAAISLIENIQREDLNLLEEAHGYQRLLTEFQFNQEEIASLVGKSRSHIANILRLLTLCTTVQEQLRSKQLSLGHARMLVGLSPKQQEVFAKQVYEEGWSVRKLEEMVRSSKNFISPLSPQENNTNDLHHIQVHLSEQVGAPVQITSEHGQGGWLKIKFYDNDTLSGLLERLGLSYD